MKRLVRAAKQVGIIYHTTSITNLYNILIDKKLYVSRDTAGVSFTRNKSFRIRSDSNAILQFNGDKLSERYVLIPVAGGDGFAIVAKADLHDRALISQYETRLVTKEGKELKKLQDDLLVAEQNGNESDYLKISQQMHAIIKKVDNKEVYIDLNTYNIDICWIDWVGPKSVYNCEGILNVDALGGFEKLIKAKRKNSKIIDVVSFVQGCNHWFREVVSEYRVVDTRVVHPTSEGMKYTNE